MDPARVPRAGVFADGFLGSQEHGSPADGRPVAPIFVGLAYYPPIFIVFPALAAAMAVRMICRPR
jgi:hypothetical protein